MDQQQQTPTPSSTTSSTATSPPQPQPQPAQPPPQQPPSTAPSTPTPSPTPNPNPNPTPRPSSSTPSRPPALHQPWRHPHPHFQHFSSSSTSSPASQPRVALGVPAASPSSFSTSFGQQFGALGRSSVNVADSSANAGNSQVRPGMGMIGTTSAGSQMRPGGIHPQRPLQSSMRAPSPSPGAPRNFQGHSFMRSPSVGPSGSSGSTATSANQPWMNPASQPKPPLPSPAVYRSITPPSMHQRSVIPQQMHSLSTTSPQQVSNVQPQQPLSSHQSQEHYGQQFPPSKISQSSAQPQQITRIQNLSAQKTPSPSAVQPNVLPTIQNRTIYAENDESGNRILSKRSIQELVAQIDPSEKLDPEVEDILGDIADDFIESITTFGCSLAKHRKSDILEAKDILLHLERNWNMTLPGFSSDEIKTYRKPVTNDIHRERLAAIKRSALVSENAVARGNLGQAAGNAKGNLTKTSGNAMLPPNPKIREVAQGS